jgi:hypothetical protein
MLLQLLDLKGHRRLGHIKDIRGFGEAELLGYGVEYLKSSVGHKSPPCGQKSFLFNHKPARVETIQ